VVAIVDETFCGHTDKHSSDFISVQCHELHWTDNNIILLCYTDCTETG